MRKLLPAMALLLLVVFCSPAPAPAFGIRHHHHAHGVWMAGPPAMAAQPQGFFTDFLLPGLLNQFQIQLPPGVRFPFNPGGGGGNLASSPVPADVADQLKKVETDLDALLAQSRKMAFGENPPVKTGPNP